MIPILVILADSLMLGVFLIRFRSIPPQIPLFYSQPWGEQQLADWWWLILLPFLMHTFIIFNQLFTKKIFSQNELITNIIKIVNLIIIFAWAGIFMKIIFLVT